MFKWNVEGTHKTYLGVLSRPDLRRLPVASSVILGVSRDISFLEEVRAGIQSVVPHQAGSCMVIVFPYIPCLVSWIPSQHPFFSSIESVGQSEPVSASNEGRGIMDVMLMMRSTKESIPEFLTFTHHRGKLLCEALGVLSAHLIDHVETCRTH